MRAALERFMRIGMRTVKRHKHSVKPARYPTARTKGDRRGEEWRGWKGRGRGEGQEEGRGGGEEQGGRGEQKRRE